MKKVKKESNGKHSNVCSQKGFWYFSYMILGWPLHTSWFQQNFSLYYKIDRIIIVFFSINFKSCSSSPVTWAI